MGLKRKASALFEPSPLSVSQQPPPTFTLPSSPPSLIASGSGSSSPSSMTTEPYQTQQSQTIFPTWPPLDTRQKHGFEEPVWMGVRTSKRSRNNRPSEEMVYSETMRKLFLAQREHFDEQADLPIRLDVVEDEDMYGDGIADGVGVGMGGEEGLLDGDTMVDCEVLEQGGLGSSLGPVEANQRSIHDFFGRRRPDIEPVQVDQVMMVEVQGDGMDIDEDPIVHSIVQNNSIRPTVVEAKELAEQGRGSVWGESQMQRFWTNRPVRLATDFRS